VAGQYRANTAPRPTPERGFFVVDSVRIAVAAGLRYNPGMTADGPSASRRRNHLPWIGPIVVFAGAVSYFLVFARWPLLRDFPWFNLPVVLAGVALSAVGLWRALARPASRRGRILSSLGLLLSLGMGGLFCFYIFSYSYRLPPSAAAHRVETLPALTLIAHDGRAIDLAASNGRKRVFVFYRGHW
jgi:hypothetical protein